MADPTPSAHRLQLGLPGYLIRFATPAFVPDRQACSSKQPSPLVVLLGSKDFAPTPEIPLTYPTLNLQGIARSPTLETLDLTGNGYRRLRTL